MRYNCRHHKNVPRHIGDPVWTGFFIVLKIIPLSFALLILPPYKQFRWHLRTHELICGIVCSAAAIYYFLMFGSITELGTVAYGGLAAVNLFMYIRPGRIKS